MLCRYGNEAHLNSPQPQAVVFLVTGTEDQWPQLDLSSVQGISMPPPASSLQIGPVLVAPNTTASSGLYKLTIRVGGLPEPLVVPFRFTNASGWTQEQTAAQQRKNNLQGQVNTHSASLHAKRSETRKLEESIQQALQGAQNSLGQSVTLQNWEQAIRHCQLKLQHLPPARSLHMRYQVLHPQQRTELGLVPGVIGFAYELLHVANEDDARLLSWCAAGNLQILFVMTWKAQEAVEALWSQWGLTQTQRLTFVPLEGLDPLRAGLQQQALPHEGASAEHDCNSKHGMFTKQCSCSMCTCRP